MKIKIKDTYEVSLYIGSVNEETKEVFSRDDLIKEIALFQESQPQTIPVRVTETLFISETDYAELGWELAVISYPRIETKQTYLVLFMKKLALRLLDNLKQKRICVVTPSDTVMYENHRFEQ